MLVHSKKFLAAITITFSLILTACSSGEPVAAVSSPTTASQVSAGTAMAALDTLPVKGRSAKTGYDRNKFGSAWADVNKNGCDTRNDILIRDLVERVMNGSCTVLSGVLYPDPYTGANIQFVRGKSAVDIDHVVALGDAWVKGASNDREWSKDKRTQFANDPLNLLAVEARANRQKSDADAATWLPSNKSYRCDYVARQIAVKAKYGLWVTSAEKTAMAGVLSACPEQSLPTEMDGAFSTTPTGVPDVSPDQTLPSPAGNPTNTGGENNLMKRYKNCTEAKTAGVTPMRKGDGLYELNTHLDRDKDGIACSS